MKKIYILLTICCVLIACKKNEVEFSFSPEAPRAGEKVQFSNLSTSGEEWAWTFGDGSTSSLKSPAHTFKQPGTYVVALKVDDKKQWTVAKEITIYDTIPTFVASDSVFYIYEDYTFTANVYNPYNYEVSYEWIYTDSLVSCDGATLKCYFTEPNDSAELALRVILYNDTTDIVKRFYIQDKPTNSVLLRTAEADYRQRIFGKRAEVAKVDTSATAMLDAEQDTIQTYSGYTVRLSELVAIEDIQGFHIANRKLYYRGNGLWVANIDGSYKVQIDSLDCTAMTLDLTDNRIYWANEKGVWYMPFVGSSNNRFVTVPTLLNEMTGVTKIAADAEKK